jgi:hypothetical protein
MPENIPENPKPRKYKMTWKARQSKIAREIRRRERRKAERDAISIGELSAAIVAEIAKKNGFGL